jgi:ankyrin repeat protein
VEGKPIEQKLIEAIRWGNRIAVLLAMKGGASVLTKDDCGNDVVLLAAGLNHWIIVDDLLHCGANVETQSTGGGNRLMHFAAANGEWAAICRLIRFKASLNPANNYGDTPLDIAIRNNHHRVIELLHQNGGRAQSEMHHVRDIAMKVAKEYTIQHFGEEYACLCGHGLSYHANAAYCCNGLVQYKSGEAELCVCDMFSDVWGREGGRAKVHKEEGNRHATNLYQPVASRQVGNSLDRIPSPFEA